MNKLFFFLITLFIVVDAQAQNLVPNESFENVNGLPCSWIGEQSEFSLYMNNWFIPTIGTSDIFSKNVSTSCYSNCFFSENWLSSGKQLPRTGNNMCGIFCYGPGGSPDYREYLEIKLKSPLIVGKTYYAEMYVSFAEYSLVACNNIGMYFSPTRVVDFTTSDPLPVTPQINSTTIISDSINWVKISGTFVASQAMNYLVIGNFFNNQNTLNVDNPRVRFSNDAFYYIDDVLVKLNCLNPSRDTTICAGSTIKLKANASNPVQWAIDTSPSTIISNDDELTVNPLETTRYFIYSSCDTGSVLVTVNPIPVFSLGSDTTLCTGMTITYDATNTNASYVWQDGSTAPTFTVNSTGHYSVLIKKDSCAISRAVDVVFDKPASFHFNMDTVICSGEEMVFDATTVGVPSYLWQDGSVNPKYTTHEAGTYAVRITNTCGIFGDTTTLYACCETINIPNLITPNGDAMNDIFTIGCLGSGGWQLEVYNAWGDRIYYSSDYQNNWNAEDISSGIYYYKVTKSNKPSYNGWLHILGE